MRLAVLGVVSDGLRELQVEARESSFKCPLGDVVRVHDADYVRSLQDKCRNSQPRPTSHQHKARAWTRTRGYVPTV